MKPYDPKKIEAKWQKVWEKKESFKADTESKKPKYYSLMEFPYPSGEGLHTGHVRGYTAMDIISRKRRMEGYNVLYPIGWDAFGLPTENYAIKTGIQPSVITKKNTDTYRKQMKSLGLSFDWSREINTTDPKYYKWTQWLFLQFLKHDLAYKKKMAINWCPKDKIGLANEEVVNGCCERCGTPVEKREKEQWMLAITKYAERLDKDLDDVDYLPQIKLQQRNWIGKSEGAEIDFELNFTSNPKLNENRGPNGEKATIKIFTTRPDTIFGATYMVLSPEHPWVTLAVDENHVGVIENTDEAQTYIALAKKKTEIERTDHGKEKTGIELKGVKAINPATKEEISIWVADYVLAQYGTGAIMAVPAHDERDFAFAKKYNLPIKKVIESPNNFPDGVPYTGDGVVINSEGFSWANGLLNTDAAREIIEEFEHRDIGKSVTTFKLRDWVFSRQRYWGEPIPVIHCDTCGVVPVPEKDLPVTLPKVKMYEPTDTGESPLAAISTWVNVKCPTCKGEAKRETDTMPNWAGSSWYFLRYIDPQNSDEFAGKDALKHWMPVDWYNGGMEHTTLHLLYSRFWNKFLFDIGLVPTSEPYKKRTSHGLILAEGGEKMSKSKGNVVNPDEVIKLYGADTLRIYEMFMGPFDQPVAWSTESIIGSRRFIEKTWKICSLVVEQGENTQENESLNPLLHKTIAKVSADIEAMSFNTAISSMMILLNAFEKQTPNKTQFEMFLCLLAPFAPHVTDELWSQLDNTDSVHTASWPVADLEKNSHSVVTIAVQVNGKVRATFNQVSDLTEEETVSKAKAIEDVQKWIGDKQIQKVIYVKNRLVNIVI